MSRATKALPVFVAIAIGLAGGVDAGPPSTALRSVEGTVLDVSTAVAEGDLEVVAVRLETTDPELGRLELLLAPRDVLRDIDFAVEPGDALRVRAFVGDSGPLAVHKVMNLTRGTIVRLRTLHAVPLWGARGEWEGGGSRIRAGHGEGRDRAPGPRR